MPHGARWCCSGCGRELGTVVGPSLSVDVERVAQVLATSKGTTVTCADCKAERTWTLKRSA